MTSLDVYTLWQDAWRRRDLHALADLYSDTAVMESPMAGGTIMGREAILTSQDALWAAFPNMVSTFEPPLLDDERLAFVVEVAGTHAGVMMGLPPTGRPFRFNLVFLFDLREGRIIRDRRIYDFTGFLIQIGVLKAKPA